MRSALSCALLWLCLPGAALAAEARDEDDDDAGSRMATVYLDYRTSFAALPPGVLAFGFRNIPRLQVSSEPTKALTFDFPLTIDI